MSSGASRSPDDVSSGPVTLSRSSGRARAEQSRWPMPASSSDATRCCDAPVTGESHVNLGDETLVGSLTETGAVVGTPLYMAPEQHAGAVVDARGDQYAFCVALYEALHRVRPFEGPMHVIALAKWLDATTVRPRALPQLLEGTG